MRKPVRVIRDHTASYADPITVAAGDVMTFSGKSDLWHGHRWLWATGPDGREGWVPDNLAKTAAPTGIALRAYAATELSCKKGERLLCLEKTHGWAWCRSASGQDGWVPINCIQTVDDDEIPL